MTVLRDATDSQMAMLADLVESVRVVEQTLSGVLAVRDGLLAVASRFALQIAEQGEHADFGELSVRAVAAQIGAAVRVSDRTVQRRMDEASWLVEHYPTVWAAQGSGHISAAHARAIIDAGAHLEDPASRAAYAAEAIGVAVRESPNRLRGRVRRLAERHQPRTITERHRDAAQLRRVWVRDGVDGMAELGMNGPAVLVNGIYSRLSDMAHAVKDADARAGADEAVHTADAGAEAIADERSIDQLRADLLADLLLTGTPSAHDTPDGLLSEIRAHVEITVPALTLIGDDDDTIPTSTLVPAELDHAVPIDTHTARVLAGAAPGWDRIFTHPTTGTLLSVDRYRPSEQIKRHLRARDQHCRFPGCCLSTRKCDIDHTHPASTGGTTANTNLAHLCRRHHTLKHHSPWHTTLLPDGTLQWRSPSGQLYTDTPPPQNTTTHTSGSSPPPF